MAKFSWDEAIEVGDAHAAINAANVQIEHGYYCFKKHQRAAYSPLAVATG